MGTVKILGILGLVLLFGCHKTDDNQDRRIDYLEDRVDYNDMEINILHSTNRIFQEDIIRLKKDNKELKDQILNIYSNLDQNFDTDFLNNENPLKLSFTKEPNCKIVACCTETTINETRIKSCMCEVLVCFE